jgi:hypothetical protein
LGQGPPHTPAAWSISDLSEDASPFRTASRILAAASAVLHRNGAIAALHPPYRHALGSFEKSLEFRELAKLFPKRPNHPKVFRRTADKPQ